MSETIDNLPTVATSTPTGYSINDGLAYTLSKLEAFDKKELVEKVKEILAIRLKNEVMIADAIKEGVVKDMMSVESAAMLMNKNKDSVSDLVRVVQLLSGEDTGKYSIKLTVEERQAVVGRIKGMLSAN